MFNIGSWFIENPTILAPMAGVSDLPYRRICKQLGAGLVVSEMISSDTRLWNSRKSIERLATNFKTEANLSHEGPYSVQLVGNDPKLLAEAAKANRDRGADIIDINMGCPAKKVCKKAAGSALLKDEKLVADILTAVVSAVDIPVTLKIRTGWDESNRNGVEIAKMAEAIGVQALAVHGRTRACAFRGKAEYDTIAAIVDAVNIPVFANGDITSARQAKAVKNYTKAAAIMVGRGAQGNPWLFQAINAYLTKGNTVSKPGLQAFAMIVKQHIGDIYHFYGEVKGPRIARKHLSWYLQKQADVIDTTSMEALNNIYEMDSLNTHLRHAFNRAECIQEQTDLLQKYFKKLATIEEIAA